MPFSHDRIHVVLGTGVPGTGTRMTQGNCVPTAGSRADPLTREDHARLATEFEAIVHDTLDTLDQFESTGMNVQMPADYEKLHEILVNATREYRKHVHASLDSKSLDQG